MTLRRVPLDVVCQWAIVSPELTVERLATCLPRLVEAGYTRVVLPRIAPDCDDLNALARAFAESGIVPIGMAGVIPGADVGSADPEERARGAKMLVDALETTVALGGDQLNGVPYAPFGHGGVQRTDARFARAARVVGEFADAAHERGVTVTFEVLNRYETSMLNTVDEALAFIEASGSPHLRVHLDTFHMAIEEERGIRRAIRTALPWLAYLELGQSGRAGLECGTVDIARIVADALDDGYEGRWGVEAFTRPALPPAVADRLSIWRSTYDDGFSLAEDAIRVIVRGWENSAVGRRTRRLERTTSEGRTSGGDGTR